MSTLTWLARSCALLAACLASAACNEIPQDAPKPYAGKEDTKPYASDEWKGDKQLYEKALAQRARFQDDFDHARMEGTKADSAPSKP